METEKNFKEEKKVKFSQFCNFKRAIGKISVFKNCSSGIRGRNFLNIFLKFLGFSGAFSYKDFSYKKKPCISFPSRSKMLFEFQPLFEKNGLTDFQKVLLPDTLLTFILLKYFSLV